MGAYSPLPWLPEGFVSEVQERVALPTVRELARLGNPFVGLLYCGLIVTSKGIRVIEFNARFGDPETQVVLRRLQTPLAHLLHSAAVGHLGELPEPEFSEEVAVTVVMASEGYPVTSAPDREITGLSQDTEGVEIAHAATKLVDGKLMATGGRVLSVVAVGESFSAARKSAYEAINQIQLEGSYYRTDIALKVDEGEDV
jgi:phosphoribosylamine--glycine ligase